MSPTISIIIPVYNAGSYLAEAIKSVLGQRYPHWELVSVDDGSTDDSATFTKNFKGFRVRYFYQSNRGQSATSNVRIANAKGDYLKFLDVDDMLHPEHLAGQLAVLHHDSFAHVSCNW